MAPASLCAQNAQQQPIPKRTNCIKIRKKRIEPDDFALEWVPRFAEHDIELEQAQEAQPKGGLVKSAEDDEMLVDMDSDDDYHFRQLDAIGHGLDLLDAFDAAVAGVTITRKMFKTKFIHLNPFRENFYHGMPRHGIFMKDFTKKLNALLERASKIAPDVIHKIRGGGGGKPRKVRVEDEDDD
ncbi:hypothetical protein DOTSEDRAFT_28940 [Dothistroma septosporum NZE10]|uniref:Uncharacterized protein n=1 Tax=Dothistroma septosporum (strain NZE10 / CBS 128990) TaxID=675120 RepID=M2Y076_DOTSN|nr:hypothetical protein DOTSEDRAFT_28940 [Dothistroma septosporum NZE10]